MGRAISTLCTAAAVVVAAAMLASPWYSIRYIGVCGEADLALDQGRIVYDSIRPNCPNQNVRDFFTSGIQVNKSPVPLVLRPEFHVDSFGVRFALPLWLIVLAFAGTAMAIRRRVPADTCHRCRYNLTGLPPSSPCPECGSPRSS